MFLPFPDSLHYQQCMIVSLKISLLFWLLESVTFYRQRGNVELSIDAPKPLLVDCTSGIVDKNTWIMQKISRRVQKNK